MSAGEGDGVFKGLMASDSAAWREDRLVEEKSSRGGRDGSIVAVFVEGDDSGSKRAERTFVSLLVRER